MTNALTNKPVTMSSREIAKLTGKEHKHVIRDIRVMLAELGDGPNLDHVREERDIENMASELSLSFEKKIHPVLDASTSPLLPPPASTWKLFKHHWILKDL